MRTLAFICSHSPTNGRYHGLIRSTAGYYTEVLLCNRCPIGRGNDKYSLLGCAIYEKEYTNKCKYHK